MQRIVITGNLTADPTLRATQNGTSVCSFTLAVNRRFPGADGQKQTDFFRVLAWRGLADTCAKYLAKGKKVCVIGQVSVSTYTAQNGETRANMDVFAEHVEFLSPASQGQQNAPQAPKTDAQSGFVQVDEETLPF